MAHALAAFIKERTDEKGWRNADLTRESGLSKQVISKYLKDERETIQRLPERTTLTGLAKALGVSTDFLLGKAIESLGLGYTSGDFVNSVATASDRELLAEIGRRLIERGEGHAGPAAMNAPDISPAAPNEQLLAQAARTAGLTEEEQAEEAVRRAMAERQEHADGADESEESDQTA